MMRLLLSSLIALLCNFGPSLAQDFPNRPIRFIVPASPGLGTDVFARLFANQLQSILKQPIYIENRPGAGGEMGAGEAVRAAPDGYTLFLSSSSVMAGNKWLYTRTFDTDKDLVPIVGVAISPLMLIGGPQFKGKTLKDVIVAAKQAPKPLTVGSAATVNSVVYGLLTEAAGVEFLLVRYRSNQQAHVDLLSGNIDLMIDGVVSSMSFVKDGKAVGLAVSAPARSESLPDVPTFRESGYDVVLAGWSGLLGPRGISPEILNILNRSGNEAIRVPEFVERLRAIGSNALGGTPEDFGRLVRSDGEVWGRMIKRFDLK